MASVCQSLPQGEEEVRVGFFILKWKQEKNMRKHVQTSTEMKMHSIYT